MPSPPSVVPFRCCAIFGALGSTKNHTSDARKPSHNSNRPRNCWLSTIFPQPAIVHVRIKISSGSKSKRIFAQEPSGGRIEIPCSHVVETRLDIELTRRVSEGIGE